jgi:hypothetical protein
VKSKASGRGHNFRFISGCGVALAFAFSPRRLAIVGSRNAVDTRSEVFTFAAAASLQFWPPTMRRR